MTNYNTELKCKDCKHASGSFIARLLRESAFFRCTIPSSYNDPVYDPVYFLIAPKLHSVAKQRMWKSKC